jgi:hypothetical protein
MGKVEDQKMVKTIAKKIIRELNANARNIKRSKERLAELVTGKTEIKEESSDEISSQDISKE